MKPIAKFLLTLLILSAILLLSRRTDLAQSPNSGKLPANRLAITTQGELRLISSNGIPDHTPGRFPNRNNPNSISEQNYRFQMALRPQKSREPAPLGMNLFGVALNGVPFDPGAAEFWKQDFGSGWQYEALGKGIDLGVDDSNAHVQPNGAYHYHGIPTALFQRLSGGKKQMTLVGFGADGFPVYAVYGYSEPKSAESAVRKLKSSYQLRKGTRRGGPKGRFDGSFIQDYEYVAASGDLDECNGREGVTPEFPGGTYYYVLTDDYPFIPRMLRGRTDESFLKRGPGGGRGGPPGRGPPRGPPRGPLPPRRPN